MPTAWGSTYTMLQRPHELKSVMLDIVSQEAHLTEQGWNELELITTAIKFPYQATVKLLQKNLTPGECMLEWKRVTFN